MTKPCFSLSSHYSAFFEKKYPLTDIRFPPFINITIENSKRPKHDDCPPQLPLEKSLLRKNKIQRIQSCY